MSTREVCYQNNDGARWYRTIRGTLYEFDYYLPWTGGKGDRHHGKSIVSRWADDLQEWVTVRVCSFN